MDLLLFRAAVHAERHGRDDDLGALALQFVDGGVDRVVVELLFLDEVVVDGDLAADFLVEDDILQAQLGLGEPALKAAARDADDADLRNVALDEGVRGLRGGVGNEHNIFRSDVVLAQAVLKALHTPAATPCSWSCVVLTSFLPMISWVRLSMATALV